MLAFGDSPTRRSYPLSLFDTLEEMFLERNLNPKYLRKVTRPKVALAYVPISCDQVILPCIHKTTKVCTFVLKSMKSENVKLLKILREKKCRQSYI